MKREFDKVQIKVQFREYLERVQLVSGELLNDSIGKIKRILEDLKPVAFSNQYSDLDGKPELTPHFFGTQMELDEKIEDLKVGTIVFLIDEEQDVMGG